MNKDDIFQVSIKGTHFSIETELHNDHDVEQLAHMMMHKMYQWYKTRQEILNQISKPPESGIQSLLRSIFSDQMRGKDREPHLAVVKSFEEFMKHQKDEKDTEH